jgi:hypothetical protein
MVPPGMPCPVTSPKFCRISCGLLPGTGRVLMVGSGGTSVDVSVQPAVRIRRISTIVRKIYCRIAIETLPCDLVVETMCPWTRKTIGSWLRDYIFAVYK